ncbi:unnamed protein product [Soboliphyme baturini]|uniref:26S proteasome non-ATPase regulatory subunit 13 n=1 Tax=Soboliphyme baturini TaxID=241478 RepID=A0A183J2W5_9BILA|nr:unnamed protein product [Soboliphyme baturini]
MLTIQNAIKSNAEAEILCFTGIAGLYLKSREPNGGCPMINKVKTLLEEAQEKLDSLQGVSIVHSEFYKISSTYFREIEDYSSYYREALRYLGCVDTDSMSESEKPIQAFCLGLAALLGEDIYNFGELLAHPILDSLQNTTESWLVDFLFAFNRGDIQRFELLRPSWSKQDDLRNNTVLLERKIRLLCLLELAFARPPTDRKISFEEIRRVCRVDMKEVEHLFMKALSKGLIKGYIDEVERSGYVSWVQPRVLDRQQIEKMSSKISQWCKDVENVGHFIENRAQEILIQ